MKVAQYTFKSPSTSPVQVGRLVPGSAEQSSTKDVKSPKESVAPIKAQTPEEWLKANMANTQKVKPVVTAKAIDTYA